MSEQEERDEFSVAVFFKDGSYAYQLRFVGGAEAVHCFKRQTETVAAKTGMVQKIIVTDGGDNTNAEWQFGKGITYPPPERKIG